MLVLQNTVNFLHSSPHVLVIFLSQEYDILNRFSLEYRKSKHSKWKNYHDPRSLHALNSSIMNVMKISINRTAPIPNSCARLVLCYRKMRDLQLFRRQSDGNHTTAIMKKHTFHRLYFLLLRPKSNFESNHLLFEGNWKISASHNSETYWSIQISCWESKRSLLQSKQRESSNLFAAFGHGKSWTHSISPEF